MWTKHRNCESVIQDAWDTSWSGFPMYVLLVKLKEVNKKLSLDCEILDKVQHRVNSAMQRLKEIQSSIDIDIMDDGHSSQEQQALKNLELALSIEYELWKEKAHVFWHVRSDRNTKYFHRITMIK